MWDCFATWSCDAFKYEIQSSYESHSYWIKLFKWLKWLKRLKIYSKSTQKRLKIDSNFFCLVLFHVDSTDSNITQVWLKFDSRLTHWVKHLSHIAFNLSRNDSNTFHPNDFKFTIDKPRVKWKQPRHRRRQSAPSLHVPPPLVAQISTPWALQLF